MAKMKRTKILSFVLIAVMLLAMAGCGSSKPSDAPSTSPVNSSTATPAPAKTPEATATPEPKATVRMMVNVTGGKDDAEMTLFGETLGDATGLAIELEKPPSDYSQVLMQKLQGGEKYDLIYVNTSEYLSLINQGALMDITDRVKASTILSNNIEQQEWEDIKVDGKVYAGFNKKELHRVVAINKIQLKNAGLDYKSIEPTLDGYYKVFKALRNANTSKDYYPFNVVMSEVFDLQPWFASIGLKDGVVVDKADGKTYAPYSTDAAAPVWEWFKKLYDEELMDPASFVDKTKDMRNKMGASSQLTGVCVDWAMWVGLHNANAATGGINADAFEIVSLPGTKTPDGSYKLVKGAASLFAVPANAQNVDGAIKVLEYFSTQEGGELLSVGIKGSDYNIENGKYVLTQTGKTHACDHGAPVPIFKDFKHPVGYNLGVEEALSYVQYSTINLGIPDEKTFKTTMGKWAIQIIKGEIGTLDGLKKMREELVSLGITQK